MRFGVIDLYCPNCGTSIRTDDKKLYHPKEFGHVCGKKCYEELEMKYARMILGKDSLREQQIQQP